MAFPKPFAVGKYEVTRAEFARFVATTGHETVGNPCHHEKNQDWRNPGFAQTGRHPVTCVNWHDAQAYVRWLSRRTGKRYRLLTEAEWEYAARAGTTTARDWVDEETGQCSYANGADVALKEGLGIEDECGVWKTACCRDGAVHTALVGRYRANRFGLHDMLGNVAEWTEDCRHPSHHDPPTADRARTECWDMELRVLRGGSWASIPRHLRLPRREAYSANWRDNEYGFRVARTPAP